MDALYSSSFMITTTRTALHPRRLIYIFPTTTVPHRHLHHRRISAVRTDERPGRSRTNSITPAPPPPPAAAAAGRRQYLEEIATLVMDALTTTNLHQPNKNKKKRKEKKRQEASADNNDNIKKEEEEEEEEEEAKTSAADPPPSTQHSRSSSVGVGSGGGAAALSRLLDDLIIKFLDPPVFRPSVDPELVLAGNFAPVDEMPPTPCPVVRGSVPQCLRGGAYVRNGPNPQHYPAPRGPHHLFDGDGMLHALLLPASPTQGKSQGTTATLCSRYVRTYRYLLEREAGAPVIPGFFSGFHGLAGLARLAAAGFRVLTGQVDPAEGVGLANTSLAFFGGRLLALGESDLPYVVHLSPDTGDISTVGRCSSSDVDGGWMTAHPKRDPVTGEVFAFRYGALPPFLTYFRFDACPGPGGNKQLQPEVPIPSVTRPCFLHDFAVTERHVVFVDTQIVMRPLGMVFGDGSPMGCDPGKVPRVGLLPRDAVSGEEMRWFDVPGFNPVHTINAWEEDGGDTLVLVAPNVLSAAEHALDRIDLSRSRVEMVRIDLLRSGEGRVTRTPLSEGNLDFGVINPAYQGRRNRYAYLGVGDPMPKISGVVKLDYSSQSAAAGGGGSREECVVARRMYGPGRFGGEPFFVAAAAEGNEDEGYLVSYVHDETTGESSFLVMDAKSPELEVVAEVSLPRRVPYGFHGLFVSERELRTQHQNKTH